MSVEKFTIVPSKNQPDNYSAERLEEFTTAFPDGIMYNDKALADEKCRAMNSTMEITLTVRKFLN